MRKLSILSLLLVIVMLSGVAITSAQDAQLGPITQRIVDRGALVCGVNASVPGFGFRNDAGEYSGMDVDICRAVAVAILGDANAVEFRAVTAADRGVVIQSGEIDMMSRNTTYTLTRDAEWGVIFGPTTFYDGQGWGTRVEYGVTTLAELDGSSICVQQGTTTELNLGDYLATTGLDIEVKTYPDSDTTFDAYDQGACESWTTDKSGIAAKHATSANPAEHMILEETISKEPLGPLSPASDEQFAEIIRWTVFGMIEAEEQGITGDNVSDFLDSESPVIQRLLGQNNNELGNLLGLENDFMVEVLMQVGNYGEIYARNMEPIGLGERGVNALWTEGGLIYSPPFR